ncbi:MAG: TonB-dependent receptor, partial [Bacteroidetes bacterium]
MLKKLLFFVSIIVFTQGVYAQSGTLQGKIYDGGNKEPIAFGNVSIYQNGSLVNGAMTDFNGKYTIKPIPAGTYTVKATYMGYKT